MLPGDWDRKGGQRAIPMDSVSRDLRNYDSLSVELNFIMLCINVTIIGHLI